jgi:integral membrane protein
MKTILDQLRWLALMEGISYISFAITMPLKYYYGIKWPNMYVGGLHGGLFIAYCIEVLLLHVQQKMKWQITLTLLVASLVPLMTFWVDRKYLKPMADKGAN